MLSFIILFALAFSIAGNVLAILGYNNKDTKILTFGVLCFILAIMLTGYAIYSGDFELIHNTEVIYE